MPEQKKIPILVLFSAWKPSEDLRPLLTDMLVTGAVIDVTAPLPEDIQRLLKEERL